MASQIKHGPLSVCSCARCENVPPPVLYRCERALFPRQLCPLPVGACIAGPPTVRGQILGSAGTANAGRASPAHTAKSRNSAYNHTRTLAAHCRGGALLHPKSLAWSQGLSGRALLAPTIESQKSGIFLQKPYLLLVGACTAGPPTVRGQILGSAGTANAGRASPAPTAKSRNSAYNYTHLSRFIVGVGLCSTRRASPPHTTQKKTRKFIACRSYHLVHHRGLEPRAH